MKVCLRTSWDVYNPKHEEVAAASGEPAAEQPGPEAESERSSSGCCCCCGSDEVSQEELEKHQLEDHTGHKHSWSGNPEEGAGAGGWDGDDIGTHEGVKIQELKVIRAPGTQGLVTVCTVKHDIENAAADDSAPTRTLLVTFRGTCNTENVKTDLQVLAPRESLCMVARHLPRNNAAAAAGLGHARCRPRPGDTVRCCCRVVFVVRVWWGGAGWRRRLSPGRSSRDSTTSSARAPS